MNTRIQSLAFAGTLILTAVAGPLSAQTMGDRVSQGSLSINGLEQLISGTGLSVQEARGMTLEDIVKIRWQDD